MPPTPSQWRQSIDHAVKVRQAHTSYSIELIRRYAGNRYREGIGTLVDNHENAEFEFIANFVPQMVFNNPKVHLNSKLGTPEHDQATKANQLGLNQWISDEDLAGILTTGVFDMPFDFACWLLTLRPDPDGERHPDTDQTALRPHLERVSPRRYFADPRRTPGRLPRFEGHLAIHDREELLMMADSKGRAVYDHAAIKELPKAAYAAEFWRDMLKDDLIIDLPGDDQVVVAEVVDHRSKQVFSLGYPVADASAPAGQGDLKYLRKPRRMFAPPGGPYHLGGIFLVPDQPYPLPILAASSELVDEINAHAGQASEDAGYAKNMVLVDSSQEQLANTIQYANNGTVNMVEGFNENMYAEVNVGGPNPHSLQWIQVLRERLDRRHGFTMTDRGQLTGVTKGEIDRASSQADLRQQFAFNQFRKTVEGILRGVLWYFENAKGVHFQIGSPDGEAPGRYYFTGGPAPGEDPRPVNVYGVEIEAYSMEYVDDFVLQRRYAEAIGMLARVAPLMAQVPYYDWSLLLDGYLDSLNIHGGSRKFLKDDMLRLAQIDHFQMMQMGAGGPGNAATAPPTNGLPMPGINNDDPMSAQLPSPSQVA